MREATSALQDPDRLRVAGGVDAVRARIGRWADTALTMTLGGVAAVCLAGTLFPQRRLEAAGVVAAGVAVAVLRSRVGVERPRASNAASVALRAPLPALERWAPLSMLLFFVPVLSHVVPPGADMAMHAALARALRDGQPTLSPAWGAVRAPAYPLGFSAWVALCSAWLGIARASVVVSAASFALYYLGLQRFVGRVLGLACPRLVAALLLLGSWTPQAFYRWGGGPSVLAMALGLVAAAELARLRTPPSARVVAFIGLLLTAAMATHPIGASLGAAYTAGAALQRARRDVRAALALGSAFVPLAALMLWLSRQGPALSARELAWIHRFQTIDENVLGSWPRWLFPLTVLRAVFVRVGPVLSALYVASCAWLWTLRERRLPLASLAAIEALGLVLAYGERLPVLGFLVYPSRLMPATVLPLALPLSAALARAARTLSERSLRGLLGVLGVAALSVHVGVYQAAQPLVTPDDLAVLRCLAREVPKDALIDGAYGDATQWVPALTGRAITHPHVHCSLFDEVDAQLEQRRPTHRLVAERLCFGDPLGTPLPPSAAMCHAGGAQLYRY